MTKNEFLDTLARVLNRELSESEVRSNIRYYEDYIDQQTAGGRSEAEVLRELGDPRLIARTILQVDQQREEAQDGYASEAYGAQTVYTENSDGTYHESYEEEEQKAPFGGRVKVYGFGWKQWLIVILVLLVVFMILGTVFAVVWRFFPFILLGAGLWWLYKRFLSR